MVASCTVHLHMIMLLLQLLGVQMVNISPLELMRCLNSVIKLVGPIRSTKPKSAQFLILNGQLMVLSVPLLEVMAP